VLGHQNKVEFEMKKKKISSNGLGLIAVRTAAAPVLEEVSMLSLVWVGQLFSQIKTSGPKKV
jgi:hypothetical protein